MKFLKFLIAGRIVPLTLANLAVVCFNAFTRWPGSGIALLYCNLLGVALMAISGVGLLKSRRALKAARKDLAAFEYDFKQVQFFGEQAKASQKEVDEAEQNFDMEKIQRLAPVHAENCKRFIYEMQILAKKYPQNVKINVEKME